MCKVMEDLRVESYTEGREEQARMMAQKLYRKGYSIEEIADMVEYSTEKVEEWLTPKAGEKAPGYRNEKVRYPGAFTLS